MTVVILQPNKKLPPGSFQRVEKVKNLEKYVSLHAEQGSRNRAEFRIWRLVGVHGYGKADKGGKRNPAQILERGYYFVRFKRSDAGIAPFNSSFCKQIYPLRGSADFIDSLTKRSDQGALRL